MLFKKANRSNSTIQTPNQIMSSNPIKKNQLKIRGLVKTISLIQEQFDSHRDHRVNHQPLSQDLNLVQDIETQITSAVRKTEGIFSETGTTAGNLPVRSRRAFQWLKFLTEPSNLSRHIQTLDTTAALARKIQQNNRGLDKSLIFRLYHIGPLYSVRIKDQTIYLTLQEAFIGSPNHLLEDLLASVLSGPPFEKPSILQYTFQPEYRRFREELAYLGISDGSQAPGSYWDLRAIFDQVNQKYFNHALDPPHLVWSSRDTYRKYGHYQFDTDTVMISTSLDRSDVPGFVLEYVMYHELLHKHLGIQVKNHRRYAHTKKFRRWEARFPDLTRARNYLQRLSNKQS